MNGIFSAAPCRSPVRNLLGGVIRLAVKWTDDEMNTVLSAADSQPPEDVFGRPTAAPRLPGETQAAYFDRVHRANEAALMETGRAVIELGQRVFQAQWVVAFRFRQLLCLQAAAASLIIGLFVLCPAMPEPMAIALWILTPIVLARGGLWFVNNIGTVGQKLAAHADGEDR